MGQQPDAAAGDTSCGTLLRELQVIALMYMSLSFFLACHQNEAMAWAGNAAMSSSCLLVPEQCSNGLGAAYLGRGG